MSLVCSHLFKAFGSTQAVAGISLSVEKGELVSVIGPSGCGKTTLLRLIAGFEQPDRGEIHLDGVRLNHLPPEARGVGVVFQHYALFPHMSVWHNIGYGLRFFRPERPKADVIRELIHMLDLQGLEQRKPAQLSAGQQQRVAIARALAPRPRLLLLDEPLSALDAQLREHVRLEIRRLQRRLGLTLLYVTHDQEEALAISDRVAVMHAGRIEQVAAPWEVYDEPQSPFVAGFLGRMNRFSGTVLGPHADGWEVHIEGATPSRLIVPKERCVASLEVGMAIDVVGRAESVVPELEGPVTEPHLTFAGRLQESEFLGAYGRLYIAGPGDGYTALVPAKRSPEYRARIGQRLVCALPFSHTRILPR